MRVTFFAHGHATVETAHHEIGNGIYTVLAIHAAECLGTTIEAVYRSPRRYRPPAGISGGSSTTTSLVPVLAAACDQLARAAISANDSSLRLLPKAFPMAPARID